MSQRLIYIMDPMCSWCWGFAPVIDAIQSQYPKLPIHLVAGGLRPGVTDPLPDSTRQALTEHWRAVAEASGQLLLTPDVLPAGFIYNTEPACRALVVARELNTDRVWALVKRIQRAFYSEGLDVTQCSLLIDLAEQADYSRSKFSQMFVAQAAQVSVNTDFDWVADLGISGFPTLLAERNGMLALLANGYQPVSNILPLLQRWIEAGKPADTELFE